MKTNTKTLLQEWEEFVAQCYPDGLDRYSDQYRQLHRAFFAGALMMFNQCKAAQSDADLLSLYEQIKKHARDIILVTRGRN